MAATDQIRQMVNFILQEAHEKANEIRVKVCFSLQNAFSRLVTYLGEGSSRKLDFARLRTS
jgi:hypothetical protein